jgi:signal transduction histidine kinase
VPLRFFNWPIRSTLVAISATALLIIVGLGGLSFVRLAMVNTTASAVRDQWLPATRDLAEVARLVEHYRMIEGIYLLVESDGERADEAQLLARAQQDLGLAWESYEGGVLAGEQRRFVEAMDRKWSVFAADSADVITLMQAGKREAAIARYMKAKDSFVELRLVMADGVAFNARAAAEASSESAAAYMETRLWIGAGVLLGALVCVASGCVAIFGVSRPILQMAQAMKRVAARDLSAEIVGVGRRGEIGEMAEALKIFRRTAGEFRAVHSELAAAKERAETANASLELRIEERTRELREAQDELLKKERLSVIGQVTATVAHELRNPLSAIRNSAFVLKASAEAAGLALDRPVTRIERSVDRCERIVAELLDYTRVREARREPRAFDEWIGELAAELTPPQGGTIGLDLRAGAARVSFDADRLRRVVINLVDNAVQAFGDTGDRAAAPRVVIRTVATDHDVILEIEDNGPGISRDDLAKVFEPLFSTKSFGTGLGLPTVKQIVEQHDGHIALTSAPGEGTCAKIRLPRAVDSLAA